MKLLELDGGADGGGGLGAERTDHGRVDVLHGRAHGHLDHGRAGQREHRRQQAQIKYRLFPTQFIHSRDILA